MRRYSVASSTMDAVLACAAAWGLSHAPPVARAVPNVVSAPISPAVPRAGGPASALAASPLREGEREDRDNTVLIPLSAIFAPRAAGVGPSGPVWQAPPGAVPVSMAPAALSERASPVQPTLPDLLPASSQAPPLAPAPLPGAPAPLPAPPEIIRMTIVPGRGVTLWAPADRISTRPGMAGNETVIEIDTSARPGGGL